jgi:hypothetical protein
MLRSLFSGLLNANVFNDARAIPQSALIGDALDIYLIADIPEINTSVSYWTDS